MDGLVYIYSPLLILYFTKYTYIFLGLALVTSSLALFLVGFVFHMPESLKFSLVKQNISKF